MKMTFLKNALQAAAVCAAKKDIREYLVGVRVDYRISAPERAHFAGTDGHVLFVGRAEVEFEDGAPSADFGVTVPLDAVKLAVKAAGRRRYVLLQLDGARWVINNAIFTPVDGCYPEFEEVIPRTVSGEKGQFDPELLARGCSAMRAYLGNERAMLELKHNGTAGPAVMQCAGAVAVIMPWNVDAADYAVFTMPAKAGVAV